MVPPRAIELIVAAAVPLLVMVTACATLVEPMTVVGKLSVLALRLMIGTAAVPVPVSATECGEPLALSVTFSVAESEPVDAGLKATEMVQVELALREEPQVVAVFTNKLLLVPEITMLLMVRAAVPLLLSVTVLAADCTPLTTEPKASEVGERLADGVLVVVGHAFTTLYTFIEPRPVALS